MNTSNFIEEFENYYFRETYKPNDYWGISRVKTTRRGAEKEIVNKLRLGEHDEYTIAWKLGEYNDKEKKVDSQRIKGYRYINARQYIDKTESNKEWIGNTIKDALDSIRNQCFSSAVKKLSMVFACLRDCANGNGLGTVYLINSMFFLSKGEIPIYDINVYTAVQALFLSKCPSQISVSEAPQKEDEVGAIIRLLEYMWLLDQVFGKDKIQKSKQFSDCEHVGFISRGLDRALWVYGQSRGRQAFNLDSSQSRNNDQSVSLVV